MIKIGKQKIFFQELGFTLVELLVSMTLFAFTVLMATGVFSAVMNGQRSVVASQNIQESIRYAMEVASKEIRMAQASDGACNVMFNPQPTPVNKVYNIAVDASNNQILYFKNQYGDCVAYYMVTGKINVMRNYNSGALTPAQIKINSLNFFIVDNAIGAQNTVQPTVSLSLNATANEAKPFGQKMDIQTTISSREYFGKIVEGATQCVPNCTLKYCGDDGCGGSCGGCLAGETCTSGTCGSVSGVDMSIKLSGIVGLESLQSFVLDDENNLYIGTQGGKFIKYNLLSGTVTNLTSKIYSIWGTTDISGMVYDNVNKVVFLAGYSGAFARYNLPNYTTGTHVNYPNSDTAYSLNGKLGAIIGPGYGIYPGAITIDNVNHRIYLAGYGGGSCRFGRYDISSDTGTSLTGYINSWCGDATLYDLEYNPNDDTVFISNGGTARGMRFGRFNAFNNTSTDLLSKISSIVTGNDRIANMFLDVSSNVVYIGGTTGDFIKFDVTAYNSNPSGYLPTDLTSKVSSFWGANSFSNFHGFAYDTINNAMFFGNNVGTLARYDIGLDAGENKTSLISSFWGANALNTAVYSSATRAIYIGGNTGKFAIYRIN